MKMINGDSFTSRVGFLGVRVRVRKIEHGRSKQEKTVFLLCCHLEPLSYFLYHKSVDGTER
jgi:hypothetical protein